ncbi:MAG TPA: class I SAM-dependent methyltransferase [Polyangiaceae bacterium]|jgi:ubiquinone/menaquinone biosynthesis C-methylase UbiE
MGPPPLPRVLEPEVMDTDEEARDYDAMDHGDVNARFVADLLAARGTLSTGARPARVLDVGTGTALIPVELCRRDAGVQVDAIDLASHMLALAERNVARAGLAGRIRVAKVDAKKGPWPPGTFDVVMSNSIVHHIPEPAEMLGEAWRLVKAGGRLFVRDLERPATDARVAELVAAYAPIPDGPPDLRAMHLRQRGLLEASLRAALTADEVRALVGALGIPAASVATTSDRHWTLSCEKP